MLSVFNPAPLPDSEDGTGKSSSRPMKRPRQNAKANKKKLGLAAKWTIRERKNRKLNCSAVEEMRYIEAEETILNLKNGFNYQPRVYMQELFKIKYNMLLMNFEALKRYEVGKVMPTKQEKEQAKKAFACIRKNDATGLKWLIENGFSPNYHNGFGSSVLLYACRKNAKACIALLIQKKANLRRCDAEGRTALHYAVWTQPQVSIEILKLLCDKEPLLLLATDWLDCTPLDCVKPTEWPKVCSFLVSTLGIYKDDILSLAVKPTSKASSFKSETASL